MAQLPDGNDQRRDAEQTQEGRKGKAADEIADAQRHQVCALVRCVEQTHAKIEQQNEAVNEIDDIEHLARVLRHRRKVENGHERERKQRHEDDKDLVRHAGDEDRGILDLGNYIFQ